MKFVKKIVKDEDGQVLVLFALLFVVIMGFAALVIDLGMVAVQKTNLQNAADAAVLAGAQDLPKENTAKNIAVVVAGKNGMKATENGVMKDGDTVTVTTPYKSETTKIEVVCTRNVKYSFARILGFTDTDVTARAVAQKSGSSSGISGLRPWALVNKYEVVGGTKKDPTSTWVDYTYTYGLSFELKVGGGGGSNGYYGIIGFDTQNANSASVYKDNITNGYSGIVKIGDYVLDGSGNDNVKHVINDLMTASGDPAGDYTKAKRGDSHVVLIPKIDAQTRKVIGFVAVYLKSVDNQGYITANFLYDTTWAEIQKGSLDDWGLDRNVQLSE